MLTFFSLAQHCYPQGKAARKSCLVRISVNKILKHCQLRLQFMRDKEVLLQGLINHNIGTFKSYISMEICWWTDAIPAPTLSPFPVVPTNLTSGFSSLNTHTGPLYTYSRCSKPWIVWHCWHANMLMETIWSRTSTAQQELAWGLGPLCTLLQNAFLWVPGLIASTVRRSDTVFPPESWSRTCRSRARRLWKPTLSFTGLLSTAGEQKPLKSHWRSGSKHLWNFRDEITLKNGVAWGLHGYQ